MENTKPWLIGLSVAVVIAILGVLLLLVILVNQNNSLQQQFSEIKQEQLIMVTDLSTKIDGLKIQPTIDQPVENKVELIKQAFSQKYNRDISEITINVGQETENHVRGGVKFGVGGVGEGGFFFAAKVGEVWKIVSDGNGEVNCSALKDYGFPANMALDCTNL